MVNEEHRGKVDADLYKQRWGMMDKDGHSSSFPTSDHAGVQHGITLRKKLLNQANVPRDQASLLWGLGDSSNCHLRGL